MKMAYIATDPKTNECYAICSADPDFIADCANELRQWKRDGATIELLPIDEAKVKFINNKRLHQSEKQLGLFSG